MEDMNINQVIDVPDTPDRLDVLRNNDGSCGDKESSLSATGHSKDSCIKKEEPFNWPRSRDKSVLKNGQCRRLFVRFPRDVSNAEENKRRSATLKISSDSHNVQSSRRMGMDKNIKNEHENFLREQHLDKGKSVCSKFLSKSPACHKGDAVVDLTEQRKKTEIPEVPCSFGASQNQLADEIRKGNTSIGVGSLNHVPHSSNTTTKSLKGKEKANSNTHEGSGSAIDSRTGTYLSCDSQCQTEKQVPDFLHSVASPRVAGKKRLVKNGCISPQNIAERAKKQSVESQSRNTKHVEQNHTPDMVSNGLPCASIIREIVAEESGCGRAKGKGVLSHLSTSNEHDATNFKFPSRTTDANGDANQRFERSGDWRSTRNRLRNNGCPLSGTAGHPKYGEINDDSSRASIQPGSYFPADRSSAQIQPQAQSSQVLSHVDRLQLQAPNNPKRQKRHETSRNFGECSSSVPDNSEIVCLGSSRESPAPTLGFGRVCGHRKSNQVIEIDESSPEVRHTGSQTMSDMNNDDPDSTSRQLQADEMLARELQEQLYNESPVVGGGETDEHIALALQREENGIRDSSGISFRSIPFPVMDSSSQSLLPVTRNRSTRRGTQARAPSRMSRLRNRFTRQSASTISRQRNLQFPVDMGIEMRLDILEALEATFGDSDVRRGHVLQVQRDFNENDYEMLLALDENNCHVGASANQINALPVSTVQTENLEECAVCLETPAIGETICHLPCLHKFHKDCIHPWLSRSTSCPVCKSSIS